MTTKKDRIIKKWTTPENLGAISEWSGAGYSDTDIAGRMGISVRSFYRYRESCPELEWAVQEGKEVVDHKAESALLKAALGYKTKEVKIILVFDKDGQLARTIRQRIIREVPPNVLACQTWLFNRQREKWKRNRDAVDVDADSEKSINITITRAAKTEAEGEI